MNGRAMAREGQAGVDQSLDASAPALTHDALSRAAQSLHPDNLCAPIDSVNRSVAVTETPPTEETLPSLTFFSPELRPMMQQDEGVTVVYVHLASNPLIEERYGWEAHNAYVGLVRGYLERVRSDIRRDRGSCIVAKVYADDYVILAPHRSYDEAFASRITDEMRRHILAIDAELAALHEVYLGMSQVSPFAKVNPERLLLRSIQRAQTEATDVGRQRLSFRTRLLDRCIHRETAFSMLYQPLVRIEDHSVFAYEALVRCREDGLSNPHMLLNVAEQGGRIWQLSRLLRRLAAEALPSMPSKALLFINVHPRDFSDPELLAPEPFVREYASRIVFEVTERAAIEDYGSFRNNIAALRTNGLRIAVDDLGSGHATLARAADLHPDFIKFDMTLVRDIDRSPIRRNLLRNMVAFAREAGVRVVAEGVETRAELDVLRDLGCHYVQGFYLARPGSAFPERVERADEPHAVA